MVSDNSGQYPVHMIKHCPNLPHATLFLASVAPRFASAQYHNRRLRTSALPRRRHSSVARVNHLFPFLSGKLRKYHAGRFSCLDGMPPPASPTRAVTLMANPQHKDNADTDSRNPGQLGPWNLPLT